MTTSPSIIGWAHSAFGKAAEPDVEALLASVTGTALDHAGVGAGELDGVFVGVFNGGLSRQGFEAGLVGSGRPELARVPALHAENACATGSAALYAALDFVQSGRGRIALVAGAEKMTTARPEVLNDALLTASYRREEEQAGSFAGVFGDIARSYFDRYGDHRETMARIAAKNHRNGVDNPHAHLRKDVGFEFCNEVSDRNPLVADPLRRTDCSLVSDGAAAVVVAAPEIAASAQRAITWRARAQANDHLPLSRRADVLEFAGARDAFTRAMATAGSALSDLDLLETHDCFTIAELLQYEAFGLTEPGKGATALDEGLTERTGTLPVNPSGGLKAKGHPIGATGISQHIMASLQLTGEAGGMQVEGAELAGVFNMGGVAVANYFSVLERLR
ncbi:acetyl-CoA acetyltransferase [Prauserella marina]|uniref:Acetyl-CoA C-acetyltransferase n=1 Tax=Prauserella marina TaxID=530584 RepID=A0A222VRZ9_9PSEU|nr:thiolase domain-containing protein [Prauserella marina]ASR36660.1 acetyl-CoA acetyltransferase [Prauserella marina]PWV74081.1 acetyl-CoA C-acetyltransferase [Prauserella marina]SDD62558.1 acetyl-CoA C-acetyltransferase [Prauserella marina]